MHIKQLWQRALPLHLHDLVKLIQIRFRPIDRLQRIIHRYIRLAIRRARNIKHRVQLLWLLRTLVFTRQVLSSSILTYWLLPSLNRLDFKLLPIPNINPLFWLRARKLHNPHWAASLAISLRIYSDINNDPLGFPVLGPGLTGVEILGFWIPVTDVPSSFDGLWPGEKLQICVRSVVFLGEACIWLIGLNHGITVVFDRDGVFGNAEGSFVLGEVKFHFLGHSDGWVSISFVWEFFLFSVFDQ